MHHGSVGRRKEAAFFRVAIERSQRSEAAPIAICGEPGIGKTHLLADLVELAEQAGNLALAGRAAQLERDVPFAVIVDALDGYLGAQNPRRLQPLGADHLSELARIFPSLAESADSRDGALQSERYRAHRAVGALLEMLSRRAPLLLALDDVQWADDASLELISHLLRRPPGERVVLALAHRRGETPARLSAALDDAQREGRIERLELGPLSAEEAFELLPETLEQDVREWLLRESGGNPFYLQQLQRSMEGRTTSAEPRTSTVSAMEAPAVVVAALAREVDELGPQARRLLDSAAVAGDPFSLDLAAAAADQAEPEAHAALDELLGRELVHSTEEPRRFRFRHPIVRRAVYLGAKAGWRLGAHARIRDELERQGAPAIELAHHVEQASSRGDAGAVDVLERAGHATAALAPAVGAHWFGVAIARLPEQDHGRRLEILLPMADALAACDRLEEARASLIEALELLPGEAEVERANLVGGVAALENLLGYYERARARLRSGLAELPDSSSAGAVSLQIQLAINGTYGGDWDAALDWARSAAAAINEDDQTPVHALVEALHCYARMVTSPIPEAEAHCTTAADIVDSLDDSALASRLDAPLYTGVCEAFLERYEAGLRHFHRASGIARASKQGQLLNLIKAGEAWCLIHLGRTAPARSLAEEMTEAARLAGNPEALGWALMVRCWVATVVGDLETARGSGEAGVTATAERSESVIHSSNRAHLALAYMEADEHERCIEQLQLAGAPDFPLFVPERRAFWLEALSRSTLALGREDEAETWASYAEELTTSLGLPVAAAAAQRARARLHLARDRPELAAPLALSAVQGLNSRGARLEAARTRVLAGQALAAARRDEPAAAELEMAFAELDACGAPRYRDQAARELRLLGRQKPRGGTRGVGDNGIAALSEREREIAELVAQAKTNREIAGTLYISEKTVEKHLTKIFQKLDVRGRAAIGAKLARGAKSDLGLPVKK